MLAKFFALPAVLTLLLASLTFAESNEKVLDPAWESHYQKAEWVGYVRVESIHSLLNQALSSESGLLAVQGYSYGVSVLQHWKSDSGEEGKLRVDLSDCPVLMALDSEYVVFASRNYRGQLQLYSCEHIVHASEAATGISWLDNLQTTEAESEVTSQ